MSPKLGDGDKLNEYYKEGAHAADELYHHVKDKAHDMYEEGKKAACQVEENLKEYADHLVKYVKEKPVTSVLIAGGIGFIISSLLRK